MAGMKTKGAVEACVIYDLRGRDETRRPGRSRALEETKRKCVEFFPFAAVQIE